MKLSIIVPCYNAEKSIEKCLESLIRQTLKDIEIIIVNDESTDNTKKLINKYESEYSNIKVFHIKKSGQSVARNLGVEKATGEYVGFVDSDDYVEYTMFESLYNKAKSKNFDIVACDVNLIFPNKIKKISSGINKDVFTKENLNSTMIFSYAVIWNKIYKKEVIKDIKFQKFFINEDVHFNFRVFSKVKSIGVIKENLINYVQNKGSITYTYDKRLYDIINSFDDIISYYKKNEIYNDYYCELEYSYVRYLFGTFLKRLSKINDINVFMNGVDYVFAKVKNTFPGYKNNKYLKNKNLKSLYFKYFNKYFAKIIYLIEKRKTIWR